MQTNMTKKKFKRFMIFYTVVTLSVIGILTISLLNIKTQVNNLKKQTEGDNLFIYDEYSEALSIYKDLEPSFLPDTFVVSRERLFKMKSQDNNQLLNDSLRIRLMNKLKGCVLFAKQDILADKLTDKDILLKMIECYDQKSMTLSKKSDKLEEKQEKRFLTFENERGDQIYYLGEVKDSTAFGNGIGLYSNENFYTGEWKDNQRHGEGRFETKKGELYIGTYQNDKRKGEGTYYFRNGDYYTGEWEDSKRSGFGTVISAKGDTLVHGYWEKDRFDRKKTKEKLEKLEK